MANTLFQELLRCARDSGVEVRHVPLGGGGGGVATVKGVIRLYVDTDADPEDQLEKTVIALRGLPQVMAKPLRTDIKRLLESR